MYKLLSIIHGKYWRMHVIRLFLVGFVLVGHNLAQGGFDEGFSAYIKEDYNTALKEWRPAAERGDPRAMLYLGTLYERGEGVKQDYGEAARLYRLASNITSTAYVSLGRLYANGYGVSQDYGEAARLYRIAASKNNTFALYELGKLYEKGLGVQKNYIEAERFYRMSIAKNNNMPRDDIINQRAYYDLASLYEKGGYGIPQNLKEALRYYHIAAEGEYGSQKAKDKVNLLRRNTSPNDPATSSPNIQTGETPYIDSTGGTSLRNSSLENTQILDFVVGTVMLWVLGLSPAITIRYVYKKPPLSIFHAALISLLVWITLFSLYYYLWYLVDATEDFSKRPHYGIALVAIISFIILRTGSTKSKSEGMKSTWNWLTGESKLSAIVSMVVFIIIIAVVFNSWVFIAEWLGLPWDSRGYR